VTATGMVTVEALGFWGSLFDAFSANSGDGCGSNVPVTGVRIGVRSSNTIRTVPFTVFYNLTSHADHTVRLTANVQPSNASNQNVTWTQSAFSHGGTTFASGSPAPTPASATSNAITVRPQNTSTTNDAGRFVRRFTATTEEGRHTAELIVIGVWRFANNINYAARTGTTAAQRTAHRGPSANAFDSFYTFSIGERVEVLGRYNSDWRYARWTHRTTGAVQYGYINVNNFVRVGVAWSFRDTGTSALIPPPNWGVNCYLYALNLHRTIRPTQANDGIAATVYNQLRALGNNASRDRLLNITRDAVLADVRRRGGTIEVIRVASSNLLQKTDRKAP